MATLNKTLVTAHDATTPFEFVIPNTQRMNTFVVEAEFSGFGYPAAENDASIELQDGEIKDDVANFERVNKGLALIADSADRAKIRLVDLATRNAKVVYTPNSANAGTVTISITFQS
jgi:hypothetical protein